MRSLFIAALVGLPSWAAAQTRIDYSQGPVLNSNRIIGLSGAFVSVAEGADAHLVNPAAFAMRYAHTRNDFFDWDWSFYLLSDFASDDGSTPEAGIPDGLVDGTAFGGFGLDFRLGVFGAGLHGYTKSYRIFLATYDSDGTLIETNYTVDQNIAAVGLGSALPWFDVTLGVAALGGTFRISGATLGDLLELSGVGVNVGAVWHPRNRPYRAGFAMNSRVRVADVVVPLQLEGFEVESMTVPARATFGGSWMFGERTYNPEQSWGMSAFTDPDHDKAAPARRYVLVSADLVLDMPRNDTVSTVSVFRGPLEPAGRELTLSPRSGVESEFWANRMRARTGFYWEPSRVASASGRLHWTAGVDVRVHVLTDWNLNVVSDIAPNYRNVGLGLSFWH